MVTKIKRRIERVSSSEHSIGSTSQVDKVLHVADDPKTLVRTLIQIGLFVRSTIDIDVEDVVSWIIHKRPAGTAVAAPTLSARVDQPVPLEEIMRGFLYANQNTTLNNVVSSQMVTFDTKAQRKMKKADEIVFSFIGLEASQTRMPWQIYNWFKE